MKKFEEPKLETLEFQAEDIMTTSNGGSVEPTVEPTSDGNMGDWA